jgi:serpin B
MGMGPRIAIAIACMLGPGCATTGFEVSTVHGAVKASNAFGFDFYRKARVGQDNFVCSPAGAAIALSMVAAGARGETQAEILRALQIAPENLDQSWGSFAAVLTALKARDNQDGLVLKVADRLWVQEGLKLRPGYVSLLRDRFRAPLAEVNFVTGGEAPVLAINRWASDATHGRIPRLLAGVNRETRLVLTNAVYLLGEWRQPFREAATHDGKFITPKESTPAAPASDTVRMMSQVSSFRFAHLHDAKMVELPYKGGLSMLVVLPDDVDGLETIEDELGNWYAEWLAALQARQVDLALPRFAATTDLELVSLLQTMGIRRAFGPGVADFSGMTEGAELFIGDALQKAWIEINEKGTEAAAVTAVEVELASMPPDPPPPPVIFHADHPFLYLIRDMESGTILFVGRVVKPGPKD